MTVPTGTSSSPAISSYDNSSTSRSQTACRYASGSASSAVLHRRRRGLASSRASGVSVAGRRARRVDGARCPPRPGSRPRLAADVPERVVQNREQPGAQVGAGLEPAGEPERLEVGVLDQILGRGLVAGQPERRPSTAGRRCDSASAANVVGREPWRRRPPSGERSPSEQHHMGCRRPSLESEHPSARDYSRDASAIATPVPYDGCPLPEADTVRAGRTPDGGRIAATPANSRAAATRYISCSERVAT